jgi:hypothetical protein
VNSEGAAKVAPRRESGEKFRLELAYWAGITGYDQIEG